MIYTIGHSNHELGVFLGMLSAHRVAVLVDVRSRPYSTHNPQHNRSELMKALTGEGIVYHWGGKLLGGLNAVKVTDPAFVKMMERVIGLQSYGDVALMCAERNPADCHQASKLTAWIHTHFTQDEVNTAHVTPDGLVDGRSYQSQQMPGTDQLSLGLGD